MITENKFSTQVGNFWGENKSRVFFSLSNSLYIILLMIFFESDFTWPSRSYQMLVFNVCSVSGEGFNTPT